MSEMRDIHNADICIISGTRGHHIIHEMHRQDVHLLHTSMVDEWDDWVRSAITSNATGWRNNAFLQENVPIAISVRYGQNQQVCRTQDRREEADHWQRIHDYSQMHTMTFAIATHIQ